MKTSVKLFCLLLFFTSVNLFAQQKTHKAATQPPHVSAGKQQLPQHANILGMTKGTITVEQLLEVTKISLDDVLTNDYHITSFKLTITCLPKQPQKFKNDESGEITDEMRIAIQGATKGCKIYFDFIRCSNKLKETMTLAPLSFVVN